MQASHVDKLLTELGSLHDKLEEASRLQIHLREIIRVKRYILEVKLEDEITNL